VLDRIDIIQLVTPSARDSISARDEQNTQESFKKFRDRTAEAQSLGEKAWGVPPGLLGPSEIEAILKEHSDWREALNRRKNVGMRSRHKIVRVALSLALFERVESQIRGSELPLPTERHFEEAFYLRPEGINLHGQHDQ
jgi:hypothetical protein